MIAYLKGVLTEKNPAYALVECNGIGYFVNTTINTFGKLPDSGSECLLYTHYAVREDAHLLYGFATMGERDLFRQLISVSGVGPGTALVILSSVSPEDLFRAIMDNDVNMLKSIKGIGPKSAQRIILDLGDKIKKSSMDFGPLPGGGNTKRHEALSALSALGYSRSAAGKALDKVLKNTRDANVEELIKQALKHL